MNAGSGPVAVIPGLTHYCPEIHSHLDRKYLICLVNLRASLQIYIDAASLMQRARERSKMPSGKSSRRGRRYPAGAHTVAVCASLRLRCDARPGVGVAELAARPEGRSAQTAATSQLTKRASAPAPRPSIAAATEIAPAGYRLPRGDVVGVQASSANNVSAKACPGRPRRIVARRLGLLDFVAARLRAS